MRWFCRHDWKTLSHTVFPSAYEQARANGDRPGGEVLACFFEKKSVTLVACSKCGKRESWTFTGPYE